MIETLCLPSLFIEENNRSIGKEKKNKLYIQAHLRIQSHLNNGREGAESKIRRMIVVQSTVQRETTKDCWLKRKVTSCKTLEWEYKYWIRDHSRVIVISDSSEISSLRVFIAGTICGWYCTTMGDFCWRSIISLDEMPEFDRILGERSNSEETIEGGIHQRMSTYRVFSVKWALKSLLRYHCDDRDVRILVVLVANDFYGHWTRLLTK